VLPIWIEAVVDGPLVEVGAAVPLLGTVADVVAGADVVEVPEVAGGFAVELQPASPSATDKAAVTANAGSLDAGRCARIIFWYPFGCLCQPTS